jgi:hypothetical protein
MARPVLCALSKRGIAVHILPQNTVPADHYFHVFLEYLPFLQGIGISFGQTYLQWDGAQPHTSNAILDVLNEHFYDKSAV